jgi:large subunit ribosomal protein L4e
MKAILKTAEGKTGEQIELPSQFNEEIRPDIIKRAVLAIHSHNIQPHGTDPEAGKKYSSKLSRRRRDYKTAYGIGISRVPRKILSHRGTRFNWQAATVPLAVGGRQAHPPKVDKILAKKINNKERRKAIRSAMAASVNKELVIKRGHIVTEYPIVLQNTVETIKKTKDVLQLLTLLGLEKELLRCSRKTQKTGRARRRGRKSKKRKGPLFVVSQKCQLLKAAANIPGVEVVEVASLNAELLAPGCDIGRLTLYTQGAIERLDKLKLFTEQGKKK